MEKLDQIVIVNNGVAILNEKVEKILNDLEFAKTQLAESEQTFRKELLNAMIENNIYSSKIGNFTITQVIPHDIITFNKDDFLLNEKEEIIQAVTTVIDKEEFNLDKFKKENPELYNKYCEHQYETEIDLKKLEKFLPNIHDKYSQRVINDKAITLRITKKK